MPPSRLPHHICAGLCFVAIAGWPASAVNAQPQSVGDNSPIVPMNDPIYASEEVLENAGLIVVTPRGAFTGGRPSMTRLQAGQSIVRFFPFLLKDRHPEGAGPNSEVFFIKFRLETAQKLSSHPKAITALSHLIDTFSPEIRQLGERPEDAKNVLAELAKPAPKQSMDLYVEADDSAYADGMALEDAGISMLAESGYIAGREASGRRAMTRMQFARAITRLYPMLLDKPLVSKLIAHPEAVAALERLIDRFAPEIRQLGEQPTQGKNALEALRKPAPFPDVPPDHWAAQAVRELQEKRIVIGEPSGQFQNPAPS